MLRIFYLDPAVLFGDTSPPHNENISRNPVSPYGSSKLTIESFCETYANVYEIIPLFLDSVTHMGVSQNIRRVL